MGMVTAVGGTAPRKPVLVSPHSYFPLDEGSGVTLNDAAVGTGLEIWGNATYPNAIVNEWTQRPQMFAPNSGGIQFPVFTDMSQNGGPTIANPRQFIFFTDFVIPAGNYVSSTEAWMSIGEWNVAPYFTVYHNTAAIMTGWPTAGGGIVEMNITILNQPPNQTYTSASLRKWNDISDGKRHTMMFVVDWFRGIMLCYLDGTSEYQREMHINPGQLIVGAGSNTYYDCIFAESDSPADPPTGGTIVKQVGSFGGLTAFARFGIVMTNHDIISRIPSLAMSLYRNPGSRLPIEWDGV